MQSRQRQAEGAGRNRALVVCGAVAAIAVVGTFTQIFAQTLRPGEALFWLLATGAAVLTGGAAVLALFPVRTRSAASGEESPALPPPPPHNLPPLSSYFTGRDGELARLRSALRSRHPTARGKRARPHAPPSPRVCVVHGLGGVGKSQLALAYARTRLDKHRLTWWLSASRPNTLRDELLELARCIGIDYDESHAVMLSRLWARLRDQPGWLLVYDDLQGFTSPLTTRDAGPRSLGRYLPPEGRGEVLITTQRREDWTGLSFGEIALAPLAPSDGLRFLHHRTGVDEAALTELGSRLGWLPLALEQAGAYLDQAKITVPEYLEQLPGLSASGAADESTFKLAIDRVTRAEPAAQDLLCLCAFLASEDVPRDTLWRHRALVPERLRRLMNDRPTFDRAVLLLVGHSLLTSAGDGRTAPVAYGLHPRVQLFIRNRLDQLGRLEWSQAAVRLIEAAFPCGLDTPELRTACEQLMPHVEASTAELSWGADAAGEGGDSEAVVRLLHRAGGYQEFRCDWTRAQALFEQETQLRDLGIGDPLGHAEAVLAVARQHFLLARLAEAESACRRALRHCREHRAQPAFLPVEARCLRELGGILREQLRFEEALDAVQQAIKIYRSGGSGRVDLDWAIAEQQSGMIHRNAGRLAKAVACYQRAERLIPVVPRPEPAGHLLLRAMLRRDLGIVAQDRGDLDEAEQQLRAALRTFQEQPGASDFDTAQIAKFLADVLRRQGEQLRAAARGTRHPLRRSRLNAEVSATLAEASTLLGPVVALHFRRRDMEEHKYAACLNKRGSLEFAQGRAAQARETLAEAERIYRRLYGERHHYRAKTLSRLGPVLRALGEADRAEAALREAASIFEEKLGSAHPNLVAVYLRLAACLKDSPHEAEALREQAAGIRDVLRSRTGGPAPVPAV